MDKNVIGINTYSSIDIFSSTIKDIISKPKNKKTGLAKKKCQTNKNKPLLERTYPGNLQYRRNEKE